MMGDLNTVAANSATGLNGRSVGVDGKFPAAPSDGANGSLRTRLMLGLLTNWRTTIAEAPFPGRTASHAAVSQQRFLGRGSAVPPGGRARRLARASREPGPARVSLVIPVRNEARNIAWVLEQISDEVDEIILVDGNSTDVTLITARSYRPDIRIVSQEGVGK